MVNESLAVEAAQLPHMYWRLIPFDRVHVAGCEAATPAIEALPSLQLLSLVLKLVIFLDWTGFEDRSSPVLWKPDLDPEVLLQDYPIIPYIRYLLYSTIFCLPISTVISVISAISATSAKFY